MFRNICVLQSKKDFEIISKTNDFETCIFLPLNLETYLICKKKYLKIINFNSLLNNKFHKDALTISLNFSKLIKFNSKFNFSFKSEIISFLRHRLYCVIFLIEVLERSKKYYNFKKILVSGIEDGNNIASKIIYNIYKKQTVRISSRSKNKFKDKIYSYVLDQRLETKNNNILLSNLGYNFDKISKSFFKRKYNIYVPNFEKIGLLKKLLFFKKRIKILNFSKNKKIQIKKKKFIKKINFTYKKKFNISKLMNLFFLDYEFYFNDLYQRILSLKNTISQNNFDLLVSNICRGLEGSILDNDINTKSLCIPHGIISKSYNKYDKIYKKYIADAVFSGESNYFSIQSKIMKDSLKTHKISGKKLFTGNLIFSTKEKTNKKKYFLFAPTVKNFYNIQYLGVETFYEFWDNLNVLDEIAYNEKIKIVVKLHPNVHHCIADIKKYFKNLTFSNTKIQNLLTDSIALLSYSSAAIEDALNSEIPVILLDLKKRYKQINISSNSKNKNEAVYYTSDKDKLVSIMKKIPKLKNLDFSKYVLSQNIEKNFEKVLSIIKKN